MNKDKFNFIWFLLAGAAVIALLFIHPFGLMQIVSFALLSVFFFYLAYESYKFDRSDSEYGHSTGLKIHPYISKLIRSAAMAIPAMLLFYLIAFFGLNYL